MGKGQRLTTLEASFLALEHPGLPMHVAGVVVFDAAREAGGPITMHELHRHIASRLRRLPKFRQLARFSAMGLDRPEWVRAGRQRMEDHVFHHHLDAPGGRKQLAELSAQIHERVLARERPLWEMHLVDGIEGDKQALIIKTHHALTDGIAGIEIAESLFDKAPMVHRADAARPALRFGGGKMASALTPLQAALGAAFTLAGGPIATPGPFNGSVGPHRNFAMATLQMHDIHALKRRLGGSVDDVLLALVASGLSVYLKQRRKAGGPAALRAMLPVSTRASADGPLGNHVTSVFVDLPLNATDPAELVRTIAMSKSLLRSAHAAAGMTLLIEAAGVLPNRLHETVLRIVGGMNFANLIVSDVPGPAEPLFLMSRRISAVYPMIPLTSAVGLSIATVSIGGVMGVGVVGDPDLVPHPERLARAVEAAVRSFQRYADARLQRAHQTRRHSRQAA